MLDNSKQHPREARRYTVCFFCFIGSRAVGAHVVRAQTFLRWHHAEISRSEGPHQLTDMNIQHYFASPDRNPSQQLPVPEHLHNSLLTRYLITKHFHSRHFHRRPLSTDGAELFAPRNGDGIGKARPCLDVNLDENWFVNVAFIMHEKKQNKKTLLVYQWGGAVCSRWGKSLGEVWTRGSTLELSSANLPPSWSPITWPFASFSLYVCLCNSFYTAA